MVVLKRARTCHIYRLGACVHSGGRAESAPLQIKQPRGAVQTQVTQQVIIINNVPCFNASVPITLIHCQNASASAVIRTMILVRTTHTQMHVRTQTQKHVHNTYTSSQFSCPLSCFSSKAVQVSVIK